MKKRGSTFTKIKKKGKDLASRIKKSALAKVLTLGATAGIAYDNILYALAHYIPQLTTPIIPVPGYTAPGMHLDDVIGQATAIAITYDGLRKKSWEQTLFGDLPCLPIV